MTVTMNAQQLKAVRSDPSKPLLILAAAGVGKTQVLTSRISFFAQECDVHPSQILAVTFTKKAAREMEERALKLIGDQFNGNTPTIGTFHGICSKILRRYGSFIGFTQRYRILDADDSTKVMNNLAKQMSVDKYLLDSMKWRLEQWRNAGLEPEHVVDALGGNDMHKDERFTLKFYNRYRAACKAMDSIDFNDLLLHTVRLLKGHMNVLHELHEQWTHVLVDEFQDTNPVQYTLVKLLVTAQRLTVVGDDYQAIHEWRGASVKNILEFENDFPNTKLVILEKNYRSRANILEAAQSVIKNNRKQRPKRLIPTKDAGAPIYLVEFDTEVDEAKWIAHQIKHQITRNNMKPSQFAILYRMNAQSQSLEKSLIRANIPYKLHGGVSFYDRKEVKDVLSYLRLAFNTRSDIDFERIVNVPTRGVGDTSLEKLKLYAEQHKLCLFDAACDAVEQGIIFKGKTRSTLCTFIEDVRALSSNISALRPSEACRTCLEKSGYIAWLREKDSEDTVERIENVEELIGAMINFEAEHTGGCSIQDFLDELTLYANVVISKDDEPIGVDTVTLMTMHSSKGLEFDHVFMCGMSESVFPHYMAIRDGKVEEERRLCYVGITRAREQLYMCYPKRRVHMFIRGNNPASNGLLEKSRFLLEIPDHLLITHSPQHHGALA